MGYVDKGTTIGFLFRLRWIFMMWKMLKNGVKHQLKSNQLHVISL